MLEFRKLPERRSRYLAVYEVLNIVVDGVVRHRTLYDVVRMRVAMTAGNNEIKPFLGHLREEKRVETRVRGVVEVRQPSLPGEPHSPTNGLLAQYCAVESRTEVLDRKSVV